MCVQCVPEVKPDVCQPADDLSESTVLNKLAEKTGLDRKVLDQLSEYGRYDGSKSVSEFPLLAGVDRTALNKLFAVLGGKVSSSSSPDPQPSTSRAASRAASRSASPSPTQTAGLVPTVHISDSEDDMPSLVESSTFEVMSPTHKDHN